MLSSNNTKPLRWYTCTHTLHLFRILELYSDEIFTHYWRTDEVRTSHIRISDDFDDFLAEYNKTWKFSTFRRFRLIKYISWFSCLKLETRTQDSKQIFLLAVNKCWRSVKFSFLDVYTSSTFGCFHSRSSDCPETVLYGWSFFFFTKLR